MPTTRGRRRSRRRRGGLDRLREAWLNPPTRGPRAGGGAGLPRPRPAEGRGGAKELKKRTLTNLYNQRPPTVPPHEDRLLQHQRRQGPAAGAARLARGADADVVVLQELKATDDQFPRLEIEEMGYNIETHGQKSFNGVAILSRLPIEDCPPRPARRRRPTSRPAGSRRRSPRHPRLRPLPAERQPGPPGPKYDYKLAWMDRPQARAAALIAVEETAVILGRLQRSPSQGLLGSPEVWSSDALFLPDDPRRLPPARDLGLTDALRAVDQGPGHLHLLGLPGRRLPRRTGASASTTSC